MSQKITLVNGTQFDTQTEVKAYIAGLKAAQGNSFSNTANMIEDASGKLGDPDEAKNIQAPAINPVDPTQNVGAAGQVFPGMAPTPEPLPAPSTASEDGAAVLEQSSAIDGDLNKDGHIGYVPDTTVPQAE